MFKVDPLIILHILEELRTVFLDALSQHRDVLVLFLKTNA